MPSGFGLYPDRDELIREAAERIVAAKCSVEAARTELSAAIADMGKVLRVPPGCEGIAVVGDQLFRLRLYERDPGCTIETIHAHVTIPIE